MHKIKQGTKSTVVQTNVPPRQTRAHNLRIQTIQTDTIENTVTPNQLKELLTTDLPGRYPVTSARGHKYLFVMYDYDANCIHATPIKSCKSEELIRGFSNSYAVLTKHGVRAKSVRLDNEISKDFKDHLSSIHLPFQLVSPGDHRANPPKRAIQTFKNHFIAMLSGTDPDFPGSFQSQVDRFLHIFDIAHLRRIFFNMGYRVGLTVGCLFLCSNVLNAYPTFQFFFISASS